MRLNLSALLLAATAAFALPAGAQVGIDISSADFGVRVTTTGSDAIRILDSSDDGIQIGSDPDYPSYGVYIPSPGVSTYGLWPNTANASGEWAMFTVDNIEAGNVSIAGLSLIARVGDAAEVDVGDIVAATGVSEPDARYPAPTARVQRADMDSAGIVGVVQSRMDWLQRLGKDGEAALESVPGPAAAGDYVRIAALGVASVRVQAGAVIRTGERLTIGDFEGQARPVRTRRIDGLTIAEGAPTLGVALEASDGVRETILVFVSPR